MITEKQWRLVCYLKNRTAHFNSRWKSKCKEIREYEIKDHYLILKQMSQKNIIRYIDSLIEKMKKKYPTWELKGDYEYTINRH